MRNGKTEVCGQWSEARSEAQRPLPVLRRSTAPSRLFPLGVFGEPFLCFLCFSWLPLLPLATSRGSGFTKRTQIKKLSLLFARSCEMSEREFYETNPNE